MFSSLTNTVLRFQICLSRRDNGLYVATVSLPLFSISVFVIFKFTFYNFNNSEWHFLPFSSNQFVFPFYGYFLALHFYKFKMAECPNFCHRILTLNHFAVILLNITKKNWWVARFIGPRMVYFCHCRGFLSLSSFLHSFYAVFHFRRAPPYTSTGLLYLVLYIF